MSHHTEAERALSSLRHLYSQMTGGLVKDSAQAKRIAEGLLSPAIARLEQAARRAPAVPVPVPQMFDALKKIIEMNIQYCIDKYGDASKAESMACVQVARKALAAAPQPPDDLKRGNPATNPDEGPSSCAHCGNPWGEAAPIDPQLLQAIQCAGFQVIKGALGYELMKLGQAYAQADHIADAGKMVAAPVQMPDPQAEIEVRSMKTYLDLSVHEWRDTLPDGTYNIYTEQQVRKLLADHGVKVQGHGQ